MAVYRYTVKHNGVYYPAGMEVPEEKAIKADVIKPSVLLDEEEIPKKKSGRPKKEQ